MSHSPHADSTSSESSSTAGTTDTGDHEPVRLPVSVSGYVSRGLPGNTRDSALADTARKPSGCNHEIGARIDALDDGNRYNDPHAFVVMPYGPKPGPDGKLIDFDAIYAELIHPALVDAGFEPFRADEETVSGDILTDMFQELLLADLVIVDMSIDNANVFYELGVRHAFRKRGIVHIQSGRDYMPFDVFNVRTLPYHVNEAGAPDPSHVERDRQNLIRVTRDTWASDSEAVHSPIFGLLDGLVEPDRQTLRTPLATGFWREFNQWEERVAVARRQKRVGDILLLTSEISNPLCKEDAIAQSGLALREMGRNELALQEYHKGLALNPKNTDFRREEAKLLNRMGRVDEAIIKLESLLADEPSETRATSYLGRIYTSLWRDYWIGIEAGERRQQAAFDAYQWAIKSIDTYLRGFNFDRNILEPGIKALTLASLLVQLAERHDVEHEPDADIQRVRALLPNLRHALRFSLDADALRADADYWTWATNGTWLLASGESERMVSRAYRKALSYARKNIFHLRSSLRQLDLFHDLGIHAECAASGRLVVQSEIDRIETDGVELDEREYPPPQTEVLSILFSGHSLDLGDELPARFPASLEDEARRQIDLALDRNEADSNDHGFSAGAAAGGDILFIEACLARGMKVHVHMPCAEADYVNLCIGVSGKRWIERYYAIRNNPRVNLYYQEERVGKAREGVDIHERNARWALYASLVLGVDKLRLIALWDGKMERAVDKDGERVSGTVRMAQQMGGIVDHVNITKLDYLFRSVEPAVLPASASVPIERRIALLEHSSLFDVLHRIDLEQIARVLDERSYAADECLAHQGETAAELFLIESGEVSVQVHSAAGQPREVERHGSGSHVGELAMIHDQPRTTSLVALGEVSVLILNRESFARIMSLRPATAQAITRMLARRLIEATRDATRQEASGDGQTDCAGRVLKPLLDSASGSLVSEVV